MANTLKFGNGEWYGKKDTILAYNDENSNYKPLPFDFSRASSATVINKDGLIETVGSGQPRIDYKDDSKGALLLEPSRTNLITDSQTFTGSPSQVNRESNSTDIKDPFGTNTAFKFTVLTSGADANTRITNSISVTNFSVSIYVNGLAGQKFELFLARDSYSQIFSTQEVLSGGWQRIELNGTFSTASTTVVIGLEFGFTSDDSVAGQEYYLTGLQIEEGSYATSYIPTQGSAVTRLADSCNQTPPDGVIGQTEGTLYAEIDFKSKPEAGSPIVGIMTLNNNVNNLQNCIILGIERQSGGINRFYPFVQVGNSTVANIIGSTLTDGVYKAAFAYKLNDFVLYVNGVQIGTDSSGAVPTTSQFLVGERFNSDTFKIADGIKETKLYNTRLSNSELQALTT